MKTYHINIACAELGLDKEVFVETLDDSYENVVVFYYNLLGQAVQMADDGALVKNIIGFLKNPST